MVDSRWIAILLALVMFLVGCHGNDDLFAVLPTPVPAPARDAETDELVGLEAELLAGINRERKRRGRVALAADERLTAAARAHSLDMAGRGFFDHTGSDGSQVGDRISAQGYAWRLYAENIACGQASASEVIADWMASRGHRKNLLSREVEQVGVGLAAREDSPCKVYWTAVFAVAQ
jgi:uncharacterized protein YkwD